MRPLTPEEIAAVLEQGRQWCRDQFWARVEREYIHIDAFEPHEVCHG